MTIEEVEKELRAAIEAQMAKGFVAKRDGGRMTDRCGCALQLWAWDRGTVEFFDESARAFGWNGPRTWSFVDGFDGKNINNPNISSTPEYDLGRRLAREYVDGVK